MQDITTTIKPETTTEEAASSTSVNITDVLPITSGLVTTTEDIFSHVSVTSESDQSTIVTDSFFLQSNTPEVPQNNDVTIQPETGQGDSTYIIVVVFRSDYIT